MILNRKRGEYKSFISAGNLQVFYVLIPHINLYLLAIYL